MTEIRGGCSVTLEAVSGNINGRGAQIAAGRGADGLPTTNDDGKTGDITLKASRDVNLESASPRAVDHEAI